MKQVFSLSIYSESDYIIHLLCARCQVIGSQFPSDHQLMDKLLDLTRNVQG